MCQNCFGANFVLIQQLGIECIRFVSKFWARISKPYSVRNDHFPFLLALSTAICILHKLHVNRARSTKRDEPEYVAI